MPLQPEARLEKFVELARSIYSDVVVAKETQTTAGGVVLNCALTFSCC